MTINKKNLYYRVITVNVAICLKRFATHTMIFAKYERKFLNVNM